MKDDILHKYIGHTPPDDKSDVQDLIQHLLGVRDKTIGFLTHVTADVVNVAALAAICHDIGKACRGFRMYMRVCMYTKNKPKNWAKLRKQMESLGLGRPGKESDASWIPHDVLGARVLLRYLESSRGCSRKQTLREFLPILLILAGHHRGWRYTVQNTKSKTEPLKRLYQELRQDAKPLPEGLGGFCPKELSREPGVYDSTTFFHEHEKEALTFTHALVKTHKLKFEPIDWKGWSGYINHRAVMGAVVGGDREDTAQFYGSFPKDRRLHPLTGLAEIVEKTRIRLQKRAEDRGHSTDIIELRNHVFEACRGLASKEKGGIFVMTGPTGSGKTLAALRVAASLEAEYAVLAVPFLTLTDQLSKMIQNDVGLEALVHVSVPPVEENGVPIKYMHKIHGITSGKANWGHCLIITTSERMSRVLVGPGTSDNYRMMALFDPGTLVGLDEADQIPPDKLYAYLRVFEQLPCSLLITSATAHVIKKIMDLRNIKYTEIIPEGTLPTIRPLRRLEYRFWEDGTEGGLAQRRVELAQEFLGKQALFIFNRIKFAAATYLELFQERPDGVFYLTSRLSPEHRTDLLREINRRLDAGLPCLTLATTMVESGIDLDFPNLAREACSWASFLQALGRCNRGGRLESGRAILFGPKSNLDKGLFPLNFGDGLGHDSDHNTLLVRARILWDKLKTLGNLPRNEHEFQALGNDIIEAELAVLFHPDEVDRDFGLEEGNMYPSTRYTLIPNDDQIQALVPYKGAPVQLEAKDGRWGSGELQAFISRNSVQVPPIVKRGTYEIIMTYKGEVKDKHGKVHQVNFLRPQFYDTESNLGEWVTAGLPHPPKKRLT